MKNKKQLDKLIYSMMTECTGINIMDSGNENGRNWQQNREKTLADFLNEPVATYNIDEQRWSISVFHYLQKFNINTTCSRYNSLKCNNWNSDIYGVSIKQYDWLLNKGFSIGDSFNTSNDYSPLSQELQGTYLKRRNGDNYEMPLRYVLLQLHNGADIRGGYTDAKLFNLGNYEEYIPGFYVEGNIDGVEVNNSYDGYTLRDYREREVIPTNKSNVELYI